MPSPLFEDYQGRRAVDLWRLDGLSLANSKAFPPPVELKRWSDARLYAIDIAAGCFRLTDRGRQLVVETV